jgi:hypothetical protein
MAGKKAKASGATRTKRAGERIDLPNAKAAMEEAVQASSDPAVKADPKFIEWARQVRDFSEVCARAKLRSYIAVLGNAMLAKASNPRIDVYSLKAGDDSPGAYDARRPAEKVLVPASQQHRFSLGTSGGQPLNNQPFFRSYRITSAMTVRGHAKPVLGVLLKLLHEVQQYRRDEAIRALAAFVAVRRDYVPKYTRATGEFAVSTAAELATVVHGFVARYSEGGGRAQAVAGGLLDALYTASRVRVGKRNEPDRRTPGDVAIRETGDENSPFVRVFEVRDKNVPPYAAEASITKVAAAGIGRAALVCIAANQEPLDSEALRKRASEVGVDLELFTDWADLLRAIVFASEFREMRTAESAIAAIRRRLIQLELAPETVNEWDALTLKRE